MRTEFTVSLPAKYKRSVTVNMAGWPEVSLEYVLEYGIKQKIASDLADPTITEAEAVEKVDAILSRLMKGELRAVGGRETDPVMAEAKRLALVAVKAGLIKANLKLKDYEDQFPALVANYIAKYPAVLITAKANVGARQEAAPVDDMADMIASLKPKAKAA